MREATAVLDRPDDVTREGRDEVSGLDVADLSGLSDDELEAGICGFASRMAAATCVWVLAIGEFERRRAWAEWGCRSMVHWLTWKCAMSPTAAREHVRSVPRSAGCRCCAAGSAPAACRTRRCGR